MKYLIVCAFRSPLSDAILNATFCHTPVRKRLDLGQEKDATTSTLVELAEVVLKNNIFTFMEKL